MIRRHIKDSEKTIRSFAFRVMRRLHAAGDHSLTVEDIKQELSVAWVLADQSFNAEAGASFNTYLINGMRMHINRYVEKHVDRRHDEVCALSLDFEKNDGDQTGTLGDVVADPLSDPTRGAEENSALAYAQQRLSERAFLFVKILNDQPMELLHQVRMIEARAEFGKSKGNSSPSCNRLTSNMVFTLMGCTRLERTALMTEVQNLGAEICGENR